MKIGEDRVLVRGRVGQRAAMVLACALLATGCASATAFRAPKAGPETTCISAAADRELLVGVALSGGGSRAAIFGAAGLEALGRLRAPTGASVLEQVSYLSSVSGGSLSAAYYALHKPPRETPVLGPGGAMTEEYQAFFTGFREKLSQDFESALLWRQIGSFRWILNSALMAHSLDEILDERLIGPGTFADLHAREVQGDSPRVMINTTLYNDGRRFVLTTLPPEASRYDFFEDLRRSAAERGQTAEYPPILVRRWESLRGVTPLELQIDPCHLHVASAVTASAAFPPVVGPITLRVGDEESYWHIGDGGLYENAGIESLLFVFLAQLQAKNARRALILPFDSSYPFAVGSRVLSRRALPWTLFSYDFSRIPAIMEERATAYASLFFRSLQIEGVFPDSQTLHLVTVRHTDAQWKDDLSDLPEACRQDPPLFDSPAKVVERIAEIPTRFAIASECDRQLLITAAAKVVAQNRQEIEDFLAGRPTPDQTAR
jgi:predicted acylesterase/phospholipase RssA